MDATPLGAGQTSEVFVLDGERVLKLYRLPYEPAAVENEFAAARLAHAHGLPVPRPLGRVERDGRPGIVFERLHGETLLERHARRPLAMGMALAALARLQARIQACPVPGLPALHETLRVDIERARLSERTRAAALAALDTLPRGDALCHGDLHPGNVVCTQQGWRVIDWEKARVGAPAADVARTELMIRYGRFASAPDGRARAMAAARGVAAAWFVACRVLGGVRHAEVAAWRLPVAAARLVGRPARNEDELRAVVEELAAHPRSA